ncbi:Peptide alpha-N-acetyltransferase [Handroanthus impetiginosus]|uniref:Peptide alpha-N-acetyltransferase n=1 Tax=Handroanthus impetiginosus TaxID=429701 RepID=A0A2G9GVJ1_9LAMI|nr:Peptide alpha-N-acetyltransferase [Handroanthus impetiginosus]
MAHLHYNHSIIAKSSQKQLFWRFTAIKYYKKIPFHNVKFTNQTTRLKKKKGIVYCCSSSTPRSSERELNFDTKNEIYENNKVHFGYLVSNENWQVRRMVETEEEMRKVTDVQAEAFHEPVFLFNDLFFWFFKAEVFSGLRYKLRNSPPDRYACLVAEPKTNDPHKSQKEFAGVVDVTVLREDSVLQHLPGMEEFLYVSGIGVLNKFRRQGVATTLLKACDMLSSRWGFEYLALRTYEDDYVARKLYSKAGYRVVSADPPWMSTWIGRRRRIFMIKQCDIQ